MVPCVVSAVKFGASSLMRSDMIVLLRNMVLRAFRLPVPANSYRTALFPCQAPRDCDAHLRRGWFRTGISAYRRGRGGKPSKKIQEKLAETGGFIFVFSWDRSSVP